MYLFPVYRNKSLVGYLLLVFSCDRSMKQYFLKRDTNTSDKGRLSEDSFSFTLALPENLQDILKHL